jgi:hypothetical protein
VSNPKEFGKKASKRFQYAVMFDEKNAMYHFALAYACFNIRNQASMIDELTVEDMDFSALRDMRSAVARERLKILSESDYPARLRKATAWTMDDQFEIKILKELLEAVVAIAQEFRKDGIHAWAAKMAMLAYYMSLDIEDNASSALMLVTARSERESALSALVEISRDGAAAEEGPERKQYLDDLEKWSGKLKEVERENLVYLEAYVNFLRRSERALQVEPYTEPEKSNEFLDKLFESETDVLMGEVRSLSEGKSHQSEQGK